MKTRTKLGVGLAAVALALTGCSLDGSVGGGGSFQDVKGIDPVNADSYKLINNVDGYPNLVIVCTGGIAFTTTTREAAGAILRTPELDRTCPGYVAPASK
jgi:hypothetical protein